MQNPERWLACLGGFVFTIIVSILESYYTAHVSPKKVLEALAKRENF